MSIPDLKSAARRLALHLKNKHAVEIKHSQALHAVAAAIGEHDWHTLLANQPAAESRSTIRLADVFYGGATPHSNSVTYIVGPVASGKTKETTRLLLQAVAEQTAIFVFDCGTSFQRMARAVGGTVHQLASSTRSETCSHGSTRFTLWQRTTTDLVEWDGTIPNVDSIDEALRGNLPVLVVVDELQYCLQALPELKEKLHEWHQGGAELVLVGQREQAFEFAPAPDKIVVLQYRQARS